MYIILWWGMLYTASLMLTLMIWYTLSGPRYLIVILNGTKNPHWTEVAKDIWDAIIKKGAYKDAPSAYWRKGKQVIWLKAAYEKWSRVGTVWSAVAHKVSIIIMFIYHLSIWSYNRYTSTSWHMLKGVVWRDLIRMCTLMEAALRVHIRGGIASIDHLPAV
jgi:hypothetical protein